MCSTTPISPTLSFLHSSRMRDIPELSDSTAPIPTRLLSVRCRSPQPATSASATRSSVAGDRVESNYPRCSSSNLAISFDLLVLSPHQEQGGGFCCCLRYLPP